MRQVLMTTVAASALALALLATGMPDAHAARTDPVRRAVERSELAGRLDADQAASYLRTYRGARRLRRHLAFTSRRELGYVIDTLRAIARRGALHVDRMRPLFLILERNRQWWATKGPPASGARLRFAGSELIFQYYPGHGLQIQPLANFGTANALWQSHQDGRLQALARELAALAVRRGGFSAWEYYFHFGGGSPPWISGMAQATGMQALARASKRLGEPALLGAARAGVGAFERATPIGVRVSWRPGAWYALYSFAPGLRVLNGMLQALIGLDAYSDISGDQRGVRAFELGDEVARERIASFDTGAWSLYSRSASRPGAEANLNYHTLNRDFARRLCHATAISSYCKAAANFSDYLEEPPSLTPFGADPDPARAGRAVRFRFTLSKVGRVGITVRSTDSGRTYLSTSAAFSRGKHFFGWLAPRFKRKRVYEYRLAARDLAGNAGAETGTVTVGSRR